MTEHYYSAKPTTAHELNQIDSLEARILLL